MKAGQSTRMVLLAQQLEQHLVQRGGDGQCVAAEKGRDSTCKGGAGTPWRNGDRVQDPNLGNCFFSTPDNGAVLL